MVGHEELELVEAERLAQILSHYIGLAKTRVWNESNKEIGEAKEGERERPDAKI